MEGINLYGWRRGIHHNDIHPIGVYYNGLHCDTQHDLSLVLLYIVMHCFVILSVVMFSFFMLRVIMKSVVILS